MISFIKKNKINKAVFSIIVFFVIALIAFGVISKIAPEFVYKTIYKPEHTQYSMGEEKEITLTLNDYIVYGKYNNSPVKWKYVFNEDLPVFQSEKIIDFIKYDDNNSSWNNSDLKKYLNRESTFSFAEKEKHINGEIFILSESQCEKLCDEDRKKAPTLEAIKNADTNFIFARKYCWYWTSTGIETNSLSVTTVTQKGGFYKTLAYDNNTGVCPAFKLNSKTVTVCGGDGSANMPYIIKGTEK